MSETLLCPDLATPTGSKHVVELCGAKIGPDNLCDNGFDDFKEAAQRGQRGDCEPVRPAFMRVCGTH